MRKTLSIIILLAAIVVGGVYYWQNKVATPQQVPQPAKKTTSIAQSKTTTKTTETTRTPNVPSQSSKESTTIDTTETNQSSIEKACVDSGGTFSGGKCTCPDDTYEFDGKDVPLYTYEEKTGYCIDAMGLPGGKLGVGEKANHPLSTKTTVFQDSGKNFSFEYPNSWFATEQKDIKLISIMSPERKKLMESLDGLGGQFAEVDISYVIDYSDNPTSFEAMVSNYSLRPGEKFTKRSKAVVNGNNVTIYDGEGYGFEVVYFVEVGKHLLEVTALKKNEATVQSLVKTVKAL